MPALSSHDQATAGSGGVGRAPRLRRNPRRRGDMAANPGCRGGTLHRRQPATSASPNPPVGESDRAHLTPSYGTSVGVAVSSPTGAPLIAASGRADKRLAHTLPGPSGSNESLRPYDNGATERFARHSEQSAGSTAARLRSPVWRPEACLRAYGRLPDPIPHNDERAFGTIRGCGSQPHPSHSVRIGVYLPSVIEMRQMLAGMKLLTRVVARDQRPSLIELEGEMNARYRTWSTASTWSSAPVTGSSPITYQ